MLILLFLYYIFNYSIILNVLNYTIFLIILFFKLDYFLNFLS